MSVKREKTKVVSEVALGIMSGVFLVTSVSLLANISKNIRNESSSIISSNINNSVDEILLPNVSYYGFEGTYEDNTEDKLIDGDPNTYVHFTSVPTSNSYIVIDMAELINVENLMILNGTANMTDYCDISTIQLSVDGVHYSDSIGSVNYGNDGDYTKIELDSPIYARYIKLSGIDTGDTWLGLSEVYWNR